MAQTLKYVIGKDYRPLTVLEVKGGNTFTPDYDKSNWVQARQYEDSLRQVFVEITNEDGSAYDLTGANVLFEGILPDNEHKILDNSHVVFYEDPTAGKFRFDMPVQAFSVAGQYKQAFFRVMKGYRNVATLEFKFEVLADMVVSGLVPRDYISPLDDLFNTIKETETKNVADLKKIVDEKISEITDLMTTLNQTNSATLSELNTAKTALEALEEKIKKDGLFTQGEAEEFKTTLLTNVSKKLAESEISIDFKNTNNFLEESESFKNELKPNLPKILLVQDLHYGHANYEDEYGHATQESINQLNHLSNINFDLVIGNGDLVHGHGSKVNTLAEMNQVRNTLDLDYPNSDIFITSGNHENNNVYIKDRNYLISEDEIKQAYEQTYLYKYFDINGTRVIVLNAYEQAENQETYPAPITSIFKQGQLNFLVNALETAGNKDVLVFMHVPPQGFGGNQPYSLNWFGKDKTTNINHNFLLKILESYVSRMQGSAEGTNLDNSVNVSFDFTKITGRLIGVICGHEHVDKPIETKNGVRVILRTCAIASDNTGKNQRVLGTLSEDAFDVIQIDNDNNKAYIKRFGFGSDLEFNY